MKKAIHSFLQLLKKLLGTTATKRIRPLGHGIKSYLAAIYYRFPASNLTVIGITGTKGKTSTTVYSGRLLNRAGFKTGYLSTAITYNGNSKSTHASTVPFEKINTSKMSSIDGVALHRELRAMVDNGCTQVVIELSSQGLEQNRHWGLGKINIGIFLNIFPEHIEAHGSWDNYLKAKSILFKNLSKNGIFIANGKDKYAEYMWNAIPNKGHVDKSLLYKGRDFQLKTHTLDATTSLIYKKNEVLQRFAAPFEATNCAFALLLLEKIQKQTVTPKQLTLVSDILGVPGRMQWVLKDATLTNNPAVKIPIQLNNTSILVDYAHEPESMKQLLETLSNWRKTSFYQHVIHILSCDGVGRDDWKKPVMGNVSYNNADYTILTTDNYTAEDNPKQIVDLMAQNYPLAEEGTKFIRETNRKKAFQKALNHALRLTGKVLIVSTGVGSEYGMTQPDGVMEWDEVKVWSELVHNFENSESSELSGKTQPKHVVKKTAQEAKSGHTKKSKSTNKRKSHKK